MVRSIICDSTTGDVIIESNLEIPKNITDPQKIGSCVTYFRRFTLKSLLAIAEVDDDGNKASKVEDPVVKEPKKEELPKLNPNRKLLSKDVPKWNGKIYEGCMIYIEKDYF